MGISCSLVNEVAIEGELTDEGIDLFEGQRPSRAPLEIGADESVRRGARVESDFGRVVDGGTTMLLGQVQHSLDAPQPGLAIATVHLLAEQSDVRACGAGAPQQIQRGGWRAGGPILLVDTMPASPRT